MDLPQLAADAGAVLLVIGFLYAAVEDWRLREVSDALWILLAIGGAVLGLVVVGSSPVAVLSWLLVSAFVLEHLLPWDEWLGKHGESAGYVEIAIYVGVGGLLAFLGYRAGIGSGGVPSAAVAAFVSALFARGLFEARVLYGGADAKAVMVAGLLVPQFATPLLPLPVNASMVLTIFPFALTLLLNAAVLAIGIPLALFVYNVRVGDRTLPQAFTSYRIDVHDLPDRFVWLRDPTFHADPEEEQVETSEDDRKMRERQRDRLLAAGATRIWVTPQIPFVVLMAGGAIVGLLAGSLAFDLFAAL